jgi:hypothetical protein
MDPDDLRDRNCQQRKRIPCLQIVGRGKGKFIDVIQRLNVPGTNTGLFQPVSVKRRPLIGMRYRPLKALQLVVL